MITIVILLILAGISILALIHSGLIKKGSKAKEEYENSQYKENMILSEYEEKISGTRSDNINTLSNINIYVDDIKKKQYQKKIQIIFTHTIHQLMMSQPLNLIKKNGVLIYIM